MHFCLANDAFPSVIQFETEIHKDLVRLIIVLSTSSHGFLVQRLLDVLESECDFLSHANGKSDGELWAALDVLYHSKVAELTTPLIQFLVEVFIYQDFLQKEVNVQHWIDNLSCVIQAKGRDTDQISSLQLAMQIMSVARLCREYNQPWSLITDTKFVPPHTFTPEQRNNFLGLRIVIDAIVELANLR